MYNISANRKLRAFRKVIGENILKTEHFNPLSLRVHS